jgi:hypothetical protein
VLELRPVVSDPARFECSRARASNDIFCMPPV